MWQLNLLHHNASHGIILLCLEYCIIKLRQNSCKISLHRFTVKSYVLKQSTWCTCSVRSRGRPHRCFPTCEVNLRTSCPEEMGPQMVRAIRNFKLENRVEREISKMKPSPAPKHLSTKGLLREHLSHHPEIKGEIARKDDKLLSLLKDVYVDSTDPVTTVQVKDAETRQEPKEFRMPKGHHFDMMDIKNIPKGKISIVEALTLLNNHKLHPETWTAI